MKSRLLSAATVLICAAAAAGLALSGCAGSSAVSSVADPVAQAAEASELAPGFKASLSEELTPPGSSETVTASGSEIFDQRTRRGTMSIHSHAEGHSFNTDAQYSKTALYMRLPSGQTSALTHGKPWIKLDLGGVGRALGISFSALSSPGASSDPSQMLSYLRATSGQVTRVGTEQVQGVATTHYRATVEYDHYAGKLAPAQRSAASQGIAALERLTGLHSQLVDVWIDGQHRVRREELTFHECLPGILGMSQIHVKLEYFDFGVQAIPSVPRSNEVADVTSYVAEKLKHVKLGC